MTDDEEEKTLKMLWKTGEPSPESREYRSTCCLTTLSIQAENLFPTCGNCGGECLWVRADEKDLKVPDTK